MTDTRRLVDEILSDPESRARLVESLQAGESARDFWRDRAKPFIAGLSSAAVVMLAFLLPSVQDLWDRWETRQAVDRYAEIGRGLMRDRHYTAAEAAFDRALELAGTQRLDLIELRMRAHVQRMEEDPDWPGGVPENLTESDFLYVLAMDAVPGKTEERASALAAYATFLAEEHRWDEAEQRLREALQLQPGSADLHVLLGNVLDDRAQPAAAAAEYRRALALDSNCAKAHYNLGLLAYDRSDFVEAESWFRSYLKLRPADAHALLRLAEALAGQGKGDAAATARAEALRLEPDIKEKEQQADAEPAAGTEQGGSGE